VPPDGVIDAAEIDAVVIGGGPAGATAARLLAQWGHSVALLTAPGGRLPAFAECLPPSNRKLFKFLEIQDAVDRAGFYRTTGNTVWWGKARRRVELYPEGWGYQVLRSELDALLLGLAQDAGARVHFGKALRAAAGPPCIDFQTNGRRQELRTRFILDCSGRAGVLGRAFRVKQPKSRTVALCAVWRNQAGWRLPDASHTLVESYGDGWAWSVPLSPSVRHVAVMVDPGQTRMLRGQGVAAAYHAEIAKTRAFRRIFSSGHLETAPWGRDARLYTSRHFCGPGFLVAGDAASMIDPLSSFGVKKAMASAWVGAVVANTCLRNPSMQETALRFFGHREQSVYDDWLKLSASWSEKPFRGDLAAATSPPPDEDRLALQAALNELKRKPSVRLRRNRKLEPQAAIVGREIVLQDAMSGDVNLVRLAEIAEQHTQVPDIFDAYNRTGTPVALPTFLAALATLVAKKLLTPGARPVTP
jgi:flavin-dependent dehydrogenase